MLTTIEASSLRAILKRELCPAPAAPAETDIGAGDVVQIRPFADQTFGGMLAVVTAAAPYGLRAYLLRPHRGGCREAWLRLKHCEVERVGRAHWPADATPFAARCEDQGAPRWAASMRKIGPGLYVDAGAALHIDANELLRAQGIPPTPRNLQKLMEAADEVHLHATITEPIQ